MKSQMKKDKLIFMFTVNKSRFFSLLTYSVLTKKTVFTFTSGLFHFPAFLEANNHFSINVLFCAHEREFQSHKGITQQYECSIVDCYHAPIYIHTYIHHTTYQLLFVFFKECSQQRTLANASKSTSRYHCAQ